MGEQNVSLANNKAQLQSFVRNLLKDIQALELMLKDEVFENNISKNWSRTGNVPCEYKKPQTCSNLYGGH